MTPVPKLGEPADLGTSYRPVSLLCPAVKVLQDSYRNRIVKKYDLVWPLIIKKYDPF